MFLTLTQTWHPIVQRFQHFRLSVASPFFVHLFGLQCLHAVVAKLWGEVMACAELNNMSWVKVHAKLYGKAKCFVWACIKVNNRRKYPDGLTLKPCQTSKTQPWWPHWSLISILRRSHTIPKLCFLWFTINSTWSNPDESQKYLCQLTELKIGP